LNIEYAFTNTIEDCTEKTINYSCQTIHRTFHVFPSGLLNQKGLTNHELLPGEFEGLKSLFHSGKGNLPFDIFSAVFYMCSRFEEYLPFESDKHDRFKVENSTAYRYGFSDVPVVELWVQKLAEKLGVDFSTDTYKQQLTIDVDDAWMYKNRCFFRTVGTQVKSLLLGNINEFKTRRAVIHNQLPDPWFTFDYLKEQQEKLSQKIQYFFLLGRKSPYDRAISLKKKPFWDLIFSLKEDRKLGLHPSYASNYSLPQLHKEFYDISTVVRYKMHHSRQHYLMLNFPNTLRNLIKLGVRYEFSMGWAGQAGFRAGISRPFPFYDLLDEKESYLQFVPFVVMDRTLKDYMNLEPSEAIVQIKKLADRIKAVGGQFTMLWHNNSISNYGEWEGWQSVFEEAISYGEVTND
jgi:hypothetical protein